MTVLDTAGLLLFIFYAVSFTKDPLAMFVPVESQAWVIRLWALVLGIVGALVNAHFGNDAVWSGPAVYAAIKEGGAAAVGAVITYHIGAGDFVGVFDTGATSAKVAVNADENPAVVTTRPVARDVVLTPEVTASPTPSSAAGVGAPSEPAPLLTPAQRAGMVDLTTVGIPPATPVPAAAP